MAGQSDQRGSVALRDPRKGHSGAAPRRNRQQETLKELSFQEEKS